MTSESMTVVISGSFRRHLAGVRESIRDFTLLGASVLSPADSAAASTDGSFVFLSSDTSHDVKELQDGHLAAISACDFLWIVSPDGTLGESTSFEIGFAVGLGKPVFTTSSLGDQMMRQYVVSVPRPSEALAALGPGRA
jgi:nucleoside 2-deoxyribosyltransferase